MFDLHDQCLRNQGYEPLRLLGEGSFSSVYTVQDLKNKQLKAVKIIEHGQLTIRSPNYDQCAGKSVDRSLIESRLRKQRAQKIGLKYLNREIIISTRLMQSYHPNIVKIFDIKKTFLYTYIYMEHLSKGNLGEYLNQNGPLEPDCNLAKMWIYQLASALEHLHSIAIAHRDLKNIGLTERLDAKLIDFGFSRKCAIIKRNQTESGRTSTINLLDDTLRKNMNSSNFELISLNSNNSKNLDTQSTFVKSNKKLTITDHFQPDEHIIQLSNSQCGTPFYIPPEMIIANKCPYDPRKSDVWSLGVTMFAIVSYKFPFTKREYTSLYKQQLQRIWMNRRVYTCFSEDAFDLIKCMLEPLPKRRYTASQVLQHDWIRKYENMRDNDRCCLNELTKSEQLIDSKADTDERSDEIYQTKSNETLKDKQSETNSIISYQTNSLSKSVSSNGLDAKNSI